MSLKEAAAFLIFLVFAAGMDSEEWILPGMVCFGAAAVLYGQANRKERNEKDYVMEDPGSSHHSPDGF